MSGFGRIRINRIGLSNCIRILVLKGAPIFWRIDPGLLAQHDAGPHPLSLLVSFR